MISFRVWIIALLVLFLSGCFSQGGGGISSRGLFSSDPEPLIGWEISLSKILVVEAEENRTVLGIPVDDGDEPYFVVVGIKSTLGTSGNTVVQVNNYRDKTWAGHLRNGQQKTIPPSMGRLRFENVSKKDVIGIVVVAVEADLTPWAMVDERVNALVQDLEGAFINAVETRTSLNVSTNAFVNDLHTSMQASARLVAESANPTQSFERRFYSLSDIDDVIGINTMVFMMQAPSEMISYPSYQGSYFTDVLNRRGADYRFYENALVFDTNEKGARYFAEVRIRAF